MNCVNSWSKFEKLTKHFVFNIRYSSEDAVGDLVAGVTVGLTVIPQALAYAGIAGLDPAVSRKLKKTLKLRQMINLKKKCI